MKVLCFRRVLVVSFSYFVSSFFYRSLGEMLSFSNILLLETYIVADGESRTTSIGHELGELRCY